MSGLLAGKVWQSDLASHLKPLAAALADIANDDGTSIYPSVAYMAWLLGKGRRSVQLGLSELREAQIIEPVGHDKGGRGQPTEYRLIEANLPKRIPWKELRKGAENAPFISERAQPTSPIKPTKGASREAKGRISEHKRAHFSTERVKPVTPDPSVTVKEPSVEPSPHTRLMEFHSRHLKGPIPDAAAQGAAIKWLLATYKPETCEACYESLLKDAWRSKVSWLTVKSEIGSWLIRNPQSTGPRIVADHGDWYEVEACNGDGTSPRYRTPEAFARLTGRDLEEVRAGWN